MASLPTKDRLFQALTNAGAPTFMLRKAHAGQYDEYESDSVTPIIDLVRDCLATGLPSLRSLAEAAKQGEYDGTREEADAYMQREGFDLLRGDIL
jgi:hypothetical protein